jgi:type II secretory pathway component PulM
MTLPVAAMEWWRGRSDRERSMLVLLATVVLAFLAWYGVASPLQRMAGRADTRLARAAELLREVETAHATLGGITSEFDPAVSDLLVLSAAEAGFALETQREQDDGDIAVSGHSDVPQALFAWIEMLRRNHGLLVANLSITRESGTGGLRVDALLTRSGR